MHTHKRRKSASCTHVLVVLHALSALTAITFNLRLNISHLTDVDEDVSIPITSLHCQWKPPKERKESTMSILEAR